MVTLHDVKTEIKVRTGLFYSGLSLFLLSLTSGNHGNHGYHGYHGYYTILSGCLKLVESVPRSDIISVFGRYLGQIFMYLEYV